MKEKLYNRERGIEYAKKWAYSRNPTYYNFDSVGGDCTSFVSQCLYAGTEVMNYHKLNGWYYRSGNDKSPSWSGVENFYQFLIHNKSVGPYGKDVNILKITKGDIAQISFDGEKFEHSLYIVDILGQIPENILVATHTFDSYGRSIASYQYKKIRLIHIEGVRKW